MDRKFIKENCRKCLRGLEVFGLWCAHNMTPDGKGLVMCTALEECPYQKEWPTHFEKGYHLKPSARKENKDDSPDDD